MANLQDQLKEASARLRARGYRLTPQRIAVLKVLLSERGHPTAEEVYRKVQQDLPTTSLATIYKTLALLADLGEVLEVDLGDGCSRYDAWQTRPHPHLVCVACERIMDLDEMPLEAPRDEVARRTGYRILAHRLDFFGVCPQCQQEGKQGPAGEARGGADSQEAP